MKEPLSNSIPSTRRLKANERLKKRKEIEMLFREGKAFSVYPLRIVYRVEQRNPNKTKDQYPVKIGFSIPKKRCPKAYLRNRNKRLLREAWRLQKESLYRELRTQQQIHLFLIFIGKEMLTFEQTQEVIRQLISQLRQRLSE